MIALGSDDGVAATGTGTVMAVTADGQLTFDHAPIPALGWPAMEMDINVAGFDPASVPLDTPVEFDLAKGEDGMFTVVAVRSDAMGSGNDMANDVGAGASEVAVAATAGSDAPITVSGTINAIDAAAGMANITHGPMTDIGMPGMTMDFPIDPSVDAAALLEDQEVTLMLRRNPDFSMTLVGIADGKEAAQ